MPGTGLYMPWWTYIVALGFGAAAMLPLGAIYAISGFGVKVGFFNELIYGALAVTPFSSGLAPSSARADLIVRRAGYMIDVPGSSRHPLGQLAYRIISGNVWYDARTVLEDQKIGVRAAVVVVAWPGLARSRAEPPLPAHNLLSPQHYMHIAPRDVIGIQIFANMLGLPINCASVAASERPSLRALATRR